MKHNTWLLRTVLCGTTLALPSLAPAAPPKPPAPPAPEELVAVDKFREELVLLSDGKGHYLAVLPYAKRRELEVDPALFYGDGKRLYSLPIQGGGMNGPDTWNYAFAEPRLAVGGREEGSGYLALREGQYKVSCGDREVVLTPVKAETAAPLLGAAQYLRSPRQHRPHALMRDDQGTYYYIDRGYHKGSERSFRIFAGPRGALKPLRMTNAVSDSEGDVFTTKSGTLRLLMNKENASWVERGKERKLTRVPVDFNRNVAMIYNELGVYIGERLGTPCDDL